MKRISVLIIFCCLFLASCMTQRVHSIDIQKPIRVLTDTSRPKEYPDVSEIDLNLSEFEQVRQLALNCNAYREWGEAWKAYALKREAFDEELINILGD